MTIIAADVGGTKTHMVVVEPDVFQQAGSAAVLYEAIYPSQRFSNFSPLLHTFMAECGSLAKDVNCLSLALPGVVDENRAVLTNLPWLIQKQALRDEFHFDDVFFMNDFQASASGISSLDAADKIVLNPGELVAGGVQVAVGAGTGLGVAWRQKNKTTYSVNATEGGHIDFAPVNSVQIKLLEFLQTRFSHVSYERLLSGAGLSIIYEFVVKNKTIGDKQTRTSRHGQMCKQRAAWVVKQANAGDALASLSVSIFVEIYAAYIGNLALLFKPAGGLYITGGIAVKILPWMCSAEFINAYTDKGRMQALVKTINVTLVTNESVGVLGALSEAIRNRKEKMK